jgi:hypothetical protein
VSFDSCFFCSGPPYADCYFDTNNNSFAAFPWTQRPAGHDDEDVIPLLAAGTLPVDSTVRIICTTYDRDATFVGADLVATRVAALH